MQFLIDSVKPKEIKAALDLGFVGITANPQMYEQENISLTTFINDNQDLANILTVEVIGSLTEMREQVEYFRQLNPKVIIKLNYGETELKLAKELKKRQIKFAFTLIFNQLQALIAAQTGADFIFFFIARNEEIGIDPLVELQEICSVWRQKNINCQIVGASIRNQQHLKIAMKTCDYAAINLALITDSFHHPQVIKGRKQFAASFTQINNH